MRQSSSSVAFALCATFTGMASPASAGAAPGGPLPADAINAPERHQQALAEVPPTGVALPPAAAGADETSSASIRLGLALGGGYASNIFLNAADIGDTLGLGRFTFDADWMVSDTIILKATYRGELELYNEQRTERQTGQLADVTLGARVADAVYLSLRAGGEHAYYPEGSVFAFTGGFAEAAARFELGSITTLRALYRLRHDAFPNYDLDNTSHSGLVALEVALGDRVELELPAELVATHYSERFLLDETGQPTASARTGRWWRFEPTLRIRPAYGYRIIGSIRGEYNDSSDAYLYTGPFGVPTALVPQQLIQGFDSYYAIFSSWQARWQAAESFAGALGVAGGGRAYTHRSAFDAAGLPLAERQRDFWVQPRVELEWRFSSFARLSAAYSYLKQWSNDALWSYSAHRVEIMLGTWYER